MNDDELRQLLHTWKAPAAPPGLRPPSRPWYATLWGSSVRIPVPVLALVLLAILVFQAIPRPSQTQRLEVRLSDFQPVPEVKPVVIRRINNNDQNN